MPQINFKGHVTQVAGHHLIRLPQATSDMLPSRGQVMAAIVLDSTNFTAPLEPDGKGGHWFEFSADMHQATQASVGDEISVLLEPTTIWPEPNLPSDFKTALLADEPAYATWQKATPMAHWEWLRWIQSTKQAETRQRRIVVSCSKLARGERRPCCFNRNMCCVAEVSKNGVLLEQ